MHYILAFDFQPRTGVRSVVTSVIESIPNNKYVAVNMAFFHITGGSEKKSFDVHVVHSARGAL